MDETEVGRIASWVGLDVGKEDDHATVISAAGERLFELAIRNDEAAIVRLLDRALESGPCALVIDQPGSIGSLAVCVARRRGVPVAYVPGLVMRRASELYPGEAKTDRRDSCVLADTARTHAPRLHWLEVGDETLERLRVLGGYDDDLAHDRIREYQSDRASRKEPAPGSPAQRRTTPQAKNGGAGEAGELAAVRQRHRPATVDRCEHHRECVHGVALSWSRYISQRSRSARVGR
jgi:hypothetical protein